MPDIEHEKIQRAAVEFAHNVGQQSGQELRFDLPSLAVLDAFLSEWLDMAAVYDAVDDQMVESLTYPLGSFVGECLVSIGLASWRLDQRNDSSLPVLELPNGKLLDLEAPVVAVLRGQVAPFFHTLALELGQAPHVETPQT